MTKVTTHHCDAGGCEESVCSEKLPEGWVTLRQSIEFTGSNGQAVTNDQQVNSYDLCQSCYHEAPKRLYPDRWPNTGNRLGGSDVKGILSAIKAE